MPCESCQAQFTVFKRKKACTECRRLYCNQCLVKRRERILCERCVVFSVRPLTKIELLKLKPKDLIFFLQSKHISTTGCVEKEELVNLVLIHVNTQEAGGGYHSSEETCANPFDQIKQTCQSLFTTISDRIASDFSFDSKTPSTNQSTAASPTSQHSSQQNIFSQPRSSRRPSSTQSNASAAPTQPPSQIATPPDTSAAPNTNPIADRSSSSRLPTQNSLPDLAEPVRPLRTKPRASSLYPNNATQIDSTNHNARQQRSSLTDGCECFDDEVIIGFHRSQSAHSQLAKPDPLAAGPSGIQPTSGPTRKSDESDDHSSFEELLCPLQTTTVTNGADNWQFVDHETLPTAAQLPFQPEASSFAPSSASPIAHLPLNRRRSDSSLLFGARHAEPMDTAHAADPFPPSGSSPLPKRARLACDRCGKRKAGLRRHVHRFKRHLEDRNLSEEAMRQQLVAFLAYLDVMQRSVSLDVSEEDDGSNEDVLQVDGRYVGGDVASSVGGVAGQEAMDTEVGSNHATDGDNEEEDDHDFWFGDDEGIHVYGTDDLSGGQRQFINLTDFTDCADLDDLTVKQLKEILMLNRIDFKGCCEKNELLDRVKRLWEELKTCPAVDKMPSNDLCKICMDAPIECVILECGHVATCTNCGKVLSECPICRQYIVRVVRLFRA